MATAVAAEVVRGLRVIVDQLRVYWCVLLRSGTLLDEIRFFTEWKGQDMALWWPVAVAVLVAVAGLVAEGRGGGCKRLQLQVLLATWFSKGRNGRSQCVIQLIDQADHRPLATSQSTTHSQGDRSTGGEAGARQSRNHRIRFNDHKHDIMHKKFCNNSSWLDWP